MIDALVDIVTGGKTPYVESVVRPTLEPGFAIGDCWNYQLRSFDCDGNFMNVMRGDIVWNPIEYVTETESETNAQGRTRVFYQRKRGRLSFNALVDEIGLSQLQILAMGDTIELKEHDPNGGVTNAWHIFDMQMDISDSIDAIAVTVSFAVRDTNDGTLDLITTGCCGTVFDNVDFEPCALPQPTECGMLSVSINTNGALPTLQLVANITDVPSGDTLTQQWFKVLQNGNQQLIATASTVIVASPGTYRYNVLTEPSGCVSSAEIVVVGDCAELQLTLQNIGGVIFADANIESASATYAWSVIPAVCPGDPPGVSTPLPDTTRFIIPTIPGVYECTIDLGTDPPCTDSATINFVSCDVIPDPVITRNGDELTVTTDMFCDPPTIVWEIDETDSGTFTPIGETTETITPTVNGQYRARLNGTVLGNLQCEKIAERCVFALCDVGVFVQNYGNSLVAQVSNCDAPVYSWEQQLGPTDWEPFSGGDPSAQTIIPSVGGNYRVTVTCGSCVATSPPVLWFPPSFGASVFSQLFEATDPAGEFEFTVTNFDLKSVGGADFVNARYAVFRNGVRVSFLDQFDINTLGNHTNWTYDEPSNVIRVKFDDQLFPGDWLLIIDTQPF